MRPVEDVAEPVLIVAVAASFGLADPPFDAEGGPLELLGVEGLVEVRRIPPPYEFLVDLAVEGVDEALVLLLVFVLHRGDHAAIVGV